MTEFRPDEPVLVEAYYRGPWDDKKGSNVKVSIGGAAYIVPPACVRKRPELNPGDRAVCDTGQQGERAFTSDGAVYELQETAEGPLWVLIGEGYECWMGTE
jgi:hypothetical protein